MFIVDSQAMEDFAAKVAEQTIAGTIFYLEGDLGAGKTTFVRGFLRRFGHLGAVKSPTFTLVEPYQLKVSGDVQSIYHFDLYRLCDPEELEYMGIQDYLDRQAISLIEWPDKGEGLLAPPDVIIMIDYAGKSRELELTAKSSKGQKLLENLQLPISKR